MSTYSDLILAEASLVSYWRLGETSGTNANDEKSTNDGTYTGGVTLNQPGALSGDPDPSAAFASASSQYVLLPSVLASGAGDFTLESWAKTSSANSLCLMSLGWSGGDVPFLGVFLLAGRIPRFQIRNDANSGPLIDSPSAVDTGWHHIVAVRASTTMLLYVDGVQVVTGTPPTGAITLNRGAIGAFSQSTLAFFMEGGLDEVAVYNAALSSGAVAAHYAAGLVATGTKRLAALGVG